MVLSTFLGVAVLCFDVFAKIEWLRHYREGREVYEPNFLGFVLMVIALYVAVSALYRFEVVGVVDASDVNPEQAGLGE